MPVIILVGLGAIIVWSLVARRFESRGIVGPVILTIIGALVVLIDTSAFVEAVDSEVALYVVELVLAVLLFVDACEVTGGLFGGEGRMLARLLLIALPVSIVLVVLAGYWLMPEANLFVLIVIACVVIPTDFAATTGLLRSERIPARIRQILNVESGYNDGLISPIFGMALAIAVALPASAKATDALHLGSGDSAGGLDGFMKALAGAVPATLFAIVVGVVIGGLLGAVTRWAVRHGYADSSGVRFIMLLAPLLTYGVATVHGLGANGFVAAFVAGVAYRFMRIRQTSQPAVAHEELLLVEEAATLATNFVWFVLGAMTTEMVVRGIDWSLALLALLALTVFRLLPVYLSTLGSSVTASDRTEIGLLGPRGTATIVFGLIAFNKLPMGPAEDAFDVTVLTVIGSILLHGLVAPLILRRVGRRAPTTAP